MRPHPHHQQEHGNRHHEDDEKAGERSGVGPVPHAPLLHGLAVAKTHHYGKGTSCSLVGLTPVILFTLFSMPCLMMSVSEPA